MGFFDSVASFFAPDAYAEEPQESPDVGSESPSGSTNISQAQHGQRIGQERNASATAKVADKGDRGGKEESGSTSSSSKKEEGGAHKADSDEEEAAIASNADEANSNEEAGVEDENDDGEEGEDNDEEDDEEEEEEEEEAEDIKPKLEEECAKTAGCRPAKHHYEECVERVTAAADSEEPHKGPKEDCVEEFFHLTHCVAQCAAGKLFKALV